MQKVYRRTSMPKCDFNKIANHTSAGVFSCKFAAYFQNTFSNEHLWMAAYEEICFTTAQFSVYFQACNQQFFRVREVCWSKRIPTNISSATHKRKAPQGKTLEFFSQTLLKQHFKREIQPTERHNQSAISQNHGTFFRSSGKGRGGLPPIALSFLVFAIMKQTRL